MSTDLAPAAALAEASGPTRSLRIGLGLAALMFVLSGFSGLVYQSVWSQYLGLILGHAAYAQALVLAIFMGGMALGALLAARLIARIRRPLLAYGFIEALIGVFALLFHSIFVALNGWLFESLLPAAGSAGSAGSWKWAIAISLILPQTVLLGTTFPLMSAALIRLLPNQAGSVLGLLYFLNSIGAALGALVATFAIVPAIGLPGAMALAGGLNLAILALALLTPGRDAAPVPSASPSESLSAPAPVGLLRVVLWSAAITGFSSFMYELGWVRMLSMVLGSSLHAFEIMLAAFIGGLAFGGLAIRRRLHSGADTLYLVGVIQVLMGCAALVTLLLYGQSFSWVSWLIHALNRSDGGYALYNLASAGIAILIMVPAAFFAGMTLPALTYALLQHGLPEKSVGQVYASNTLGAIAGVFFMIHLAIPMVGLKLAVILAGTLDIVLGLYLLRVRARELRPVALAIAAVAALVCIGSALKFADFNPRLLASGVYRTGIAEVSAVEEVFYFRDGKTASIALTGQSGKIVGVSTNGKPDAAINLDPSAPATVDELTMVTLGLAGFAFHPRIEKVGIIGFGSGMTTHVVAGNDRVRSIETIEIEPEIIKAARGFGVNVERAFKDPRSHIIIDDARAHFSSTRAQYDLIISEPSNPWVNGVAKLFSREFYGFVPDHLAPGGLLVQWVHAYEIEDRTLLSIYAALNENFSDYRVFMSNDSDLIIVATPTGQLPEMREDFLENPEMKRMAARIGLYGVSDLRMRMVLSRTEIVALLDVVQPPINSDFYPYVSYQAPRDRFRGSGANQFMLMALGPASIYARSGVYELPTITDFTPPMLNVLADNRVRAQALAHGLQTGEAGESALAAYPDVLENVVNLRAAGLDCFASLNQRTALTRLLEAFETTGLATLAQHRTLWSDTQWLGCVAPATLPAQVAEFLALFKQVVNLQPEAAEEAQRLARQYPEMARTLVGFAIHSALQAGRPEEAKRYWTEWQGVIARTPQERWYFESVMARRPFVSASP